MERASLDQPFRDRREAGRRLGQRLAPLADEHPVVFGLPHGGVPVAFEVARALHSPLDVLVVRKIGAPGNPEYGIGAIAEGGERTLTEGALASLALPPEEIARASAHAEREVAEQVRGFRGNRVPIDIRGRTAIVVDDGLATGGTARAALRAMRSRSPARLVLAVPVGASATLDALAGECDQTICLARPEHLWAVGSWYDDFGQTSDAEVRSLLAQARWRPMPASSGTVVEDDPPPRMQAHIPLHGGETIVGDLAVPHAPTGIVVFAHGSGSSRYSPRNRDVAAALNRAGHATLLIDLLTFREERWRVKIFDLELLAQRLVAASGWVRGQRELARLPLGYFGASTGAGAALWAAAELDDRVAAVVSRGGRPDLAGRRLGEVRAPTLLIVGGQDDVVVQLNRDALAQLRCDAHLEIVPGATHLFEEPGALDQVARLATAWFTRHLVRSPRTHTEHRLSPTTRSH